MLNNILTNVKIGKRLGLGFGVILALLAVSVGIEIWGLDKIESDLDRMVKVNNKKIQYAFESNSALDEIYIDVGTVIISKSALARTLTMESIKRGMEKLKNSLDHLEGLETNEEGKRLIAAFKDQIGSARDLNNRSVELVMAGSGAEAASLYEREISKTSEKIRTAAMSIVDYQKKRNEFRVSEAKRNAEMIRWTSILLGIVALGIGLLLSKAINKSISLPLSRSVAHLEHMMVHRDFSVKVSDSALKRKDEMGDVGRSIEKINAAFRDILKEIGGGIQTLAAASTELSAASTQMAGSTKQTSEKSSTVAVAAEEMSSNMASVASGMQQATMSLNNVATATEEMTSTIGEIAMESEKARSITEKAVSQAIDVSNFMKDLGQSAQEIGKVSEAITSISDQTNLLALNATIEAARAGAAGKGFAVVANEIKELARQTASATEDIKGKIKAVQSSAGGAINDIEKISSVIKEVSGIVSSIATAIEEQSSVTKEIAKNIAQASAGVKDANDRVSQTSSVSQQISKDISGVNGAASEIQSVSAQVQSSSGELAKLAEELGAMVGRFKV